MESLDQNNFEKNLKKILKETKQKKDRILIEQKIVKKRILSIFESEEQLTKFKSLPQDEKSRLAFALIKEINFLSENEILEEGLGDFLSKLFGGALGSVLETIVEPLVDSILSGLGIKGYFKGFLKSFLTSNPKELAKALTDCQTLTRLIANSLAEGLFMMIQEDKGLEGGFYSLIRNLLGGAVKDTKFINKIEDFIGDAVCSVFNKVSGNAEEILQKVQGKGLATA